VGKPVLQGHGEEETFEEGRRLSPPKEGRETELEFKGKGGGHILKVGRNFAERGEKNCMLLVKKGRRKLNRDFSRG